jgi:hypothetical protein
VKKLWTCVGIVTLGCVTAPPITAQLVREEAPPAAATVPAQSPADAPAGKPRVSQEIQLTGDQHWVDSGIDVKARERVILTASGKLRYADAPDENGPEGRARGWKDLLRILPFNDAGRGAVLARIGDADSGQPFAVNQRRDLTSRAAGRLFLGINQTNNESAQGTYRVRVEIYAAAAGAPTGGVAVAREVAQVQGVDANLISKIPRRNGDKDGNPGDMVNFLIIGSEPGMQRAFELAGWVKVDRTKKDAVLHGILSSISKESYVQMPMSELYLFGRPQDYGFAHAEPLVVVAQRHHLRIWKVPFQVNGQTVWAGAATHDIGFERDKRNNGVTHKIDANIDAERDYVGKTLSETGLVAERASFLPSDALTEAKTATGGSFHSNGKILILKLGDTDRDLSAAFAQTFCSVLQEEKPDSGGWGPCSDYLQNAAPSGATATRELGPIPTNYRVLVIPGAFSSCQANTLPFQEGQEHLRRAHGMTVEFLQMPNDTSTGNGQRIAAYLRGAMQKDSRKYIVVTYSKGSPDLMEALAMDPQARAAVAAYVTVAGAIGGSPIAETMPAIAERYAASLKLGSCEGNIADAFKSLRQDVRKAFLADHPDLGVPAFSLAAVSDASNTSKMLLEAWKLLTAYDARTDSQLLQEDALVPGGNFLGVLRGDHLAVALNYESSADSLIRSAADHNRYPRVALLESAVRVAMQSLSSQN